MGNQDCEEVAKDYQVQVAWRFRHENKRVKPI